MDYIEFRERVGKLTLPEETPRNLFEGLDSMHYMVQLGTVTDGEYRVTLSESGMKQFLDVIILLETRGAVREVDYVVCCCLNKSDMSLGVHTNNKFLSEEDFDDSVRKINT